jgi:hypothetical protein
LTNDLTLTNKNYFIETTIEDIEITNELLKEILLRKSDELNKATRTYFEYLKAWLKIRDDVPPSGEMPKAKGAFLLSEARKALNTSHGSQKRYMSILIDNYFIKKEKTKEGFMYSVNSYEDYKQLKNKVSTTLDDILLQLKNNEEKNLNINKTVHGSNAVQLRSEPLKAASKKKSNSKKTEVHKNNHTPTKNNLES